MKEQKHTLFEVIQEAKKNPTQRTITRSEKINESPSVSPLDACTCTGNCMAIM